MILKALGGGYKVRWREHGVLRQKTVNSHEEARKLDAKKVLLKRGGQRRRPTGPQDASVQDYAERWLALLELRVQPKTFSSYKETMSRYILPAIGRLQVRDVESEDIEEMFQRAVTKSTRGQLSPNTLRIIRQTCSGMFRRAIKQLTLDIGNPCKDLDVPVGTLSDEDRKQSVRDRTLSYEQLGQCLNAARRYCSRRDYMVLLALAESGARPSEMLALRWTDVDTERRRVRIERSVTLGGLIKRTKSEAVRTVPLTVPLAEALTAWRRRIERVASKAKVPLPELVFPSRTGGPLQAKPLGRRFRALLGKAGLPSAFTLYSLRHTFCSQLLDQGVKPVNVAKLMGHKDVITTLRFYSHALPQDDTPYLDRLTAARQAVGDLNGDLVRTKSERRSKNAGL